MPLPRALARFNRRATNRVMGLWAGTIPPWMMVHHRGRVSGRAYATPVWAFATEHSIVVALTYGAGSDWVRNVLAAGEARVDRSGEEQVVHHPRIVTGQDGLDVLPGVVHPVLRVLRVDEFLVFDLVERPG